MACLGARFVGRAPTVEHLVELKCRRRARCPRPRSKPFPTRSRGHQRHARPNDRSLNAMKPDRAVRARLWCGTPEPGQWTPRAMRPRSEERAVGLNRSLSSWHVRGRLPSLSRFRARAAARGDFAFCSEDVGAAITGSLTNPRISAENRDSGGPAGPSVNGRCRRSSDTRAAARARGNAASFSRASRP